MQDLAFRADQRNQTYAPHVEPINRLVDELASQGLGWVPRVAPVHGGVDVGQQASPGCDATKAGTVTLRLIIRRSPDGHQTPILTNRTDLSAAKAGRRGTGGKALVDPAAGLALRSAQADLASAKKTSRGTSSHLPLGQVRPGSRLLETERKLLTHAIRMSAYNSESALARLLAPHYAHSEHEGRALLREAFTLPGDLQVIGDTLHVRLDPASAPRRSKALAALCTVVNNAGITAHLSHLADVPVAAVRRVVEVNLLGSLLWARLAAQVTSPARGGPGGAIVNVSSAAAAATLA